MKAKVLVSFAGVKYSGIPGQEIIISEEGAFNDLLRAGYIEAAEEKEPPKEEKAEPKKPAPKKTKK